MIFNLKDFDHLRSDPTVQFKEEIVDGVEVISICYMISNDELWKKPFGRECRGHSFRKDTGELISMAFQKFFNASEVEETQIHNVNWNDEFEVLDKRDGSLITGAIINDKVFFKSKKSYFSDVAILANKLASEDIKNLTKLLIESGLSPIWEFTHPEWKIVLDYGNPTWTLLAIRDMSSGYYFSNHAIKKYIEVCCKDLNIKVNTINIIENFNIKSYDEIKESVENLTHAEGYVIHFPSTGFRMKTKCKWYNDRHHINTDLRERDVAKYTVEETLDDVKSTIVELGYDMTKVSEIEAKVVLNMINIKTSIECLANEIRTYPIRKDAALKLSGEKFFGEAIKLIDGRDIDYKKIWTREYLREYSLKTVYSDFNHIKETNDI